MREVLADAATGTRSTSVAVVDTLVVPGSYSMSAPDPLARGVASAAAGVASRRRSAATARIASSASVIAVGVRYSHEPVGEPGRVDGVPRDGLVERPACAPRSPPATSRRRVSSRCELVEVEGVHAAPPVVAVAVEVGRRGHVDAVLERELVRWCRAARCAPRCTTRDHVAAYSNVVVCRTRSRQGIPTSHAPLDHAGLAEVAAGDGGVHLGALALQPRRAASGRSSSDLVDAEELELGAARGPAVGGLRRRRPRARAADRARRGVARRW